MELTDKQKEILQVLANEIEINPEISQAGLDIELLGNKVGAYQGIGVIYDVAKLQHGGFVSKGGNKVIITQKGLNYIGSYRKRKYYWLTALLTVIGIIVAIYTNNFLYFILGVISSIIAGIIVFLITRGSRH
jgi:hypothetical protein